MALTRFEFLAALYDNAVYPLPAVVREGWKALYDSHPLAAYIVGRVHFSRPPAVVFEGLLSLPDELISHVAHYLGRRKTYSKLFNLCRGATALSYRIKFEAMELKARSLYLHDDFAPNCRDLYKLYWRIEKMLAIQGHYWLWYSRDDVALRGPCFSPLFETPEVDWKAALMEVGNRIAQPLPHVRSLTIPAAADMWSRVRAVKTSPKTHKYVEANMMEAVEHGVWQLHCPNLTELYAPNVQWEGSVTAVEEFFRRHRDTLKVYVGPVESEDLKAITGRYTAGFPALDYRALRNWQFVEYREVSAASSKWPRYSKKIPSNTPSIRGVGFSCDVYDGTIRIVSLPCSLNISDVVPNFTAVHLSHRPACPVLARVGELGIRLFSLEVGPCLQEPGSCPARAAVRQGLINTESLEIKIVEGCEVCSGLKSLVAELAFSGPRRRRSSGVDQYRSPEMQTGNDRQRRLSAALMSRCHDGVELRFRAWSAVDRDCSHHKALSGVVADATPWNLRWFARNCNCNLSWNANCAPRSAQSGTVSIHSRADQTSPERAAFESHFEGASSERTAEGPWEEFQALMRFAFRPQDGNAPGEEDAEW